MKELINIQNELKAPKNQRNNFGNYNYRSLEDICEAIKPLLKKYECDLYITDELLNIGERYYIKATATLMNKESVLVFANGYAREAETKKGMDDSQITGATSSYARKYALNGLFLIDDVKDSDATNKHEKDNNAPKVTKTTTNNAQNERMATSAQLELIRNLTGDGLVEFLELNKIESLPKVTLAQASKLITLLKAAK